MDGETYIGLRDFEDVDAPAAGMMKVMWTVAIGVPGAGVLFVPLLGTRLGVEREPPPLHAVRARRVPNTKTARVNPTFIVNQCLLANTIWMLRVQAGDLRAPLISMRSGF